MGRHCRVRRPVHNVFPRDFPERLRVFKEASGLSWREMARRLGVSPQRVRCWRNGTVPGSTHLFFLMQLADELGLGDILRRPAADDPLPVATGRGRESHSPCPV